MSMGRSRQGVGEVSPMRAAGGRRRAAPVGESVRTGDLRGTYAPAAVDDRPMAGGPQG